MSISVLILQKTFDNAMSHYFRPYLQYCFCENPRGLRQLILRLYFRDHFLGFIFFTVFLFEGILSIYYPEDTNHLSKTIGSSLSPPDSPLPS